MISKIQNFLWCAVLLGLLSVLISGCVEPLSSGNAMEDLNDEYATVRVAAIKKVAENNMTEAIPRLVSLLLNDDGAVRFYAIEALRQLTGKDHGYRYSADEASRAAAVERWYNDEEIFGSGTAPERRNEAVPIF